MKGEVAIMAVVVIAMSCLLFVGGCSESEVKAVPYEWVAYGRVIPAEKKQAAADWITKTVGAANPHSDEEPEDSIKQAERSAVEIFGEVTVGIRTRQNGVWIFVPYVQCGKRQKRMCDEYMGEPEEAR